MLSGGSREGRAPDRPGMMMSRANRIEGLSYETVRRVAVRILGYSFLAVCLMLSPQIGTGLGELLTPNLANYRIRNGPLFPAEYRRSDLGYGRCRAPEDPKGNLDMWRMRVRKSNPESLLNQSWRADATVGDGETRTIWLPDPDGDGKVSCEQNS